MDLDQKTVRRLDKIGIRNLSLRNLLSNARRPDCERFMWYVDEKIEKPAALFKMRTFNEKELVKTIHLLLFNDIWFIRHESIGADFGEMIGRSWEEFDGRFYGAQSPQKLLKAWHLQADQIAVDKHDSDFLTIRDNGEAKVVGLLQELQSAVPFAFHAVLERMGCHVPGGLLLQMSLLHQDYLGGWPPAPETKEAECCCSAMEA